MKKRLIAGANAVKYPAQKMLAAAYGVSSAAVCAILEKQREKIEKMATEGDVSRKRTKCGSVDSALVEWLHYVDGKLTLSGTVLLERARRLAKMRTGIWPPIQVGACLPSSSTESPLGGHWATHSLKGSGTFV